VATKHIVKVKRFEGPLDLLLHLVKVNEIDIFDLDIYRLTKQYLEFLRMIDFDDLADAGEFLGVAAQLIQIKSRMLLPGQKKTTEEEEDEDPRASLQERLATYEAFKLAAAEIGSRPMLGVDVYTNHEAKRIEPEYDHIEKPWIGEPSTLVVLYEQLLKSITERRKPKTVAIKAHKISIEDTITGLENQLEKLQFVHFQGLYSKFRTRYELVIHIMAILELAKKEGVSLLQPENHGPLWLYSQNANLEIIENKPNLGEHGHKFELPEGLSMEKLLG